MRSLTGTFHGLGERNQLEWPPTPFRLFQALVAGAFGGRHVGDEAAHNALTWLEAQGAPTIYAPVVHRLNDVQIFVPNNDLDAVGGEPQRVGEIRSDKKFCPRMFNKNLPFHYLWQDITDDMPEALPVIVQRLHTFGLGIDAAFADSKLFSSDEIKSWRPERNLLRYYPSKGSQTPVPISGSLDSLTARYKAFGERLDHVGKKTKFTQPPKPVSGRAAYNALPHRLMVELRNSEGKVTPLSPTATAPLIEAVRQTIATSFPNDPLVERLIIGRGAGAGDISSRLRIIPLPSVGHQHADQFIRRILIELPQSSPLNIEAIRWALEGALLDLKLRTASYCINMVLTDLDKMAHHYINATPCTKVWRSVTPVILPSGKSGRLGKSLANVTSDNRFAQKASRYAARDDRALLAAIRHAGVSADLVSASLRREPFTAKGQLAGNFVVDTRFPKDRAYHAKLFFAEPVRGPLVIGDGRFLGLGLFEPQPVEEAEPDRWAFIFDRGLALSDHEAIARQLRRAVMSRVQHTIGVNRQLPSFVSGHEPGGDPLRSGTHKHLFYRLIIGANEEATGMEILLPEHVNNTHTNCISVSEKRVFAKALLSLHSFMFRTNRINLYKTNPVIDRPGDTYKSKTPYVTTRRPRRNDDRKTFVKEDLQRQARRFGFVVSDVSQINDIYIRPDGRVSASIIFTTQKACSGPVLLGFTAHHGGGDCRTVP